ncbi:MAG: substrate-binding domain-containing protein [Clostridiales Family XIII bacterium]|jgi:phosphate transport system substrate-binding protein|nr:substrate-binding domain-containing protein [Clostridiales Family XIII bacterium]
MNRISKKQNSATRLTGDFSRHRFTGLARVIPCVLVIPLIVAALTFAGCAKPNDAPATPSGKAATGSAVTAPDLSSINEKNYPAIDGSTANLPLLAALYAKVCGVTQEVAETKVSTNGTSNAWQNVTDGDVDMIVAYEPESDAMNAAKSAGVDIEALGRDGLVFLTAADNPVDSLTADQLRGIYSGRIKNWKDVGGKDEPIAAFQRNEGSGSQTLFEKLVMKGERLMDAPQEFRKGEMGMLLESLSEFDGEGSSIGYSVFYYASEMYAMPNLKMIAVEGVKPATETIADKSYPLTNNFYVALCAPEPAGASDDGEGEAASREAVGNGEGEDMGDEQPPRRSEQARLIRDFLLSEDGTRFIQDAGYVPVRSASSATAQGNATGESVAAGAEQGGAQASQSGGFPYGPSAVEGFPKNIVKANHAEGFTDDKLSDIVDKTVDERFADKYEYDPTRGFPLHSSVIYDAYTEGGLLKIFVLAYEETYQLDGDSVTAMSGSIVPAALTYKIADAPALTEYLPAQDGSLYVSSIKAFCTMPASGKKIKGLAKKITNNEAAVNESLHKLHRTRLIAYLKYRGLQSAKLREYEGAEQITLY